MPDKPRKTGTQRSRAPFLDAEQPTLLRSLRRCSLTSDYTRWEALRADLNGMGYRVVVVKGIEHLYPLGG